VRGYRRTHEPAPEATKQSLAGGRSATLSVSSSRWEPVWGTRAMLSVGVARADAPESHAPESHADGFHGRGSASWLDGRPAGTKEIEYFRPIPIIDSHGIFCGDVSGEV
jgi:hypothetical protein